MSTYNPNLTLALFAAADKAAQEQNADMKQMLMASAVFVAGMIFSNHADDPEQQEAALCFHESAVRYFVADMHRREAPAG